LESQLTMKYKHVFFIWLLADVFLAAGLLCFGVYLSFTGGNANDVSMLFMIMFYGLLVSLPSLVAMLLFHLLFQRIAVTPEKYVTPYITLIIVINILYLLIGVFSFHMTTEFNIFYIGSTLAGLLSFFIINKRIKKS
jgi:hypothetical protein